MNIRWTARRLAAAMGGTLVLALQLSLPAPGRADPGTASWEALMDGDHVALLRHAHAPGTDDPPAFAGMSIVLVTHQVNITALSGVAPQSGEIVVVRPDGDDIVVLGSIP